MVTFSVLALATLQFSQGTPNLPTDLPRRGSLGLAFSGQPTAEGLAVQSVVQGLSGDRAGLKPGDILMRINDRSAAIPGLGAWVREQKSGATLTFIVVRDGKQVELKGALIDKPRDPGTPDYEVLYSHVVSNGARMRTIITRPRTQGKYPGFFFIQGFSPVSYDFTLATSTGDVQTLDGPLLHDFAKSGFVTIRVEKPGVGDSEGGPFAPMDFMTELDIYRQTLKQLKAMPEVDGSNVFIFGHSMGGSFGPMVAAENPVKGLAVYGVASRTWFEYLLDTIRYQGLVAGLSYADTDERVRRGARLMALVMLENKAPAEIKRTHPELAGEVDAYFPGGLFNGKSLDFWRQLGQINHAELWSKLDSYVFAAKGAADFVVYEADHKLIADTVNRAHPGKGTWEIIPNSDHLFHEFPTEQESMKNFQKGKFTMNFATRMKAWIREVMAKT